MNTTTAEEMRAEVARLRALIEQHEERARVHAEERAAHYAEMARVTGECETLRRTLALSQESLAAASSGRRVTVVDEIERLQRERDEAERARDALYDTAREWACAEDALTSAIVAADGHGTDDAYAAAVARRNTADAALRAATVTP
jgi:chromosome segregation ATPase